MDIKGTTRVCGLIGNPVGHSISPVIHNTLADITKTNMVYTTFKVDKEDVAKAVEGAYALDILGLNVTVPHKQSVMDVLVDIDPLAKAIGAVNTLVRKDGGYKGYNTDILGLKRELEDESISLCGNNCIILGAGGAARAIASLCAQSGANKVYMLNRTIEKPRISQKRSMVTLINSALFLCIWMDISHLQEADISLSRQQVSDFILM